MKRIGLDLRILDNRNRTGIGGYAYSLALELIKNRDEQYCPIGEFSDMDFETKGKINVDIPHSNLLFAEKLLSLIGFTEGLDLMFSPYYPIPRKRVFKGVLTIHDLIPLRYPQFFRNQSVHDFFDIYIRQSAKTCDHLITDSEATKKDIIDYYCIEEEKISVIPLAAGPIFTSKKCNVKDSRNCLERYNIKSPYILSVCTIEPRKNLSNTIKAYEQVRSRNKVKVSLVLVGGIGWNYSGLIEQLKGSTYHEDIILTGYVDDEDLPVIYQNAEVFVYPSLYEGFGLPVLEAMACGVPVVTSNCSSLPEVGGDAVLYCDPYDEESIVFAMERIIYNEAIREELMLKGIKRASLFSWAETARRTREVFLKCLESSD